MQRVWHAWERELFAEVSRDRDAPGRNLPRRVEEMLRRRETLLSEVAAGRPPPTEPLEDRPMSQRRAASMPSRRDLLVGAAALGLPAPPAPRSSAGRPTPRSPGPAAC